MAQTRNAADPLSFMSLIPLLLSPVNRPATLRTREIEKDESAPPPPQPGGHAAFRRGTLWRTLYSAPWGRSRHHLSLREGSEQPPFPLALHRPRIGPRRQGYASPLRALDGSRGPIRKPRCLRGERGGLRRGVRKANR